MFDHASAIGLMEFPCVIRNRDDKAIEWIGIRTVETDLCARRVWFWFRLFRHNRVQAEEHGSVVLQIKVISRLIVFVEAIYCGGVQLFSSWVVNLHAIGAVAIPNCDSLEALWFCSRQCVCVLSLE